MTPAAAPERVDAVVVGAGPAGGSAALALAGQGARVLLLEGTGRRPARVGESLPAEARPLLRALGLWERFRRGGHLPCYGNRSAWGSDALAEAPALFNPHGHGWQLDRQAFDALLAEAAAEAGAARLRAGRVLAWEPTPAGGVLRFATASGPASVRAGVVIDASGRAAAVARGQGVRRRFDDKLVALAAVHRTAAPGDPDTTTTVESVADGWWYTAQLPGGLRSFVFLSDGDLLDPRADSSPAGWLARLGRTRHLRELAGRFGYEPVGPTTALAARSSRLARASGAGWVAAGDAAVSFDPLSSQGLLTALTTGREAAGVALDLLGGRRGAVQAYEDTLDRLYRDYLARKAAYYALERRWPTAPFWSRRAGRVVSQALGRGN